jgi:hypothetical protein
MVLYPMAEGALTETEKADLSEINGEGRAPGEGKNLRPVPG